ncbi:MAG: hypothetical protein HWN66_07025 [Candidatus Helarchaeota archaeon]|nr:hypothetical protein [Candidatus Helarchaeota archaeon]
MDKLKFIRSKNFFKIYLQLTLIILISTLVSNLLGLVGNFAIQTIAGILSLISLPLMVGQVLLNFTNANRNDQIGRKIIQLSYTTIIVACVCLTFIMMSSFLFSISFSASNSTHFAQLLAAYTFSICISFGICLTIVCYITIIIETAWSF